MNKLGADWFNILAGHSRSYSPYDLTGAWLLQYLDIVLPPPWFMVDHYFHYRLQPIYIEFARSYLSRGSPHLYELECALQATWCQTTSEMAQMLDEARLQLENEGFSITPVQGLGIQEAWQAVYEHEEIGTACMIFWRRDNLLGLVQGFDYIDEFYIMAHRMDEIMGATEPRIVNGYPWVEPLIVVMMMGMMVPVMSSMMKKEE